MTNQHKYPELETTLGTYLVFTSDDKLEEAKKQLYYIYNFNKKKFEKNGDKIWCYFSEPEFIHRKQIIDPFSPLQTLGIKFTVRGRAFYIKRNFRTIEKFQRIKCKKGIPKRKWGKPTKIPLNISYYV